MKKNQQEYVICASLQNKPQIPKMKIRINEDLNIQQLLENILKAYREEVDKEIFQIQNIPLFQLLYQNQELENSGMMSECLGTDGNYEVSVVFINTSRSSTKDKINSIDYAISSYQTHIIEQIEYDHSNKKFIIAEFLSQDILTSVPVKFTFKCEGEELTFYDLKQMILIKFSQQQPFNDHFKKSHLFALKIQNKLIDSTLNENRVHDEFPNDQSLEVSLLIQFPPLEGLQMAKDACNALVQTGIKFCQGLFYVEDQLKKLDEQSQTQIIDQYVEYSLVQYKQIADAHYTDQIRLYYKKIVDYYKVQDKTLFYSTVLGYGILTFRNASVLSNVIDLSKIVSESISKNALEFMGSISSTGCSVALGVIQLAFLIGGLYSQRLSAKDFALRFLFNSVSLVTQHVVYGMATSASLSLLGISGSLCTGFFPILGGILLGWAAATLVSKGAEWILNWLFPKKELSNDQECLPDISQEQFYMQSLKFIGCNYLTSNQDIKKRKLQMLKEFHPDQAKEKYNKDYFLQVLTAFEAIQEYRRLFAMRQHE